MYLKVQYRCIKYVLNIYRYEQIPIRNCRIVSGIYVCSVLILFAVLSNYDELISVLHSSGILV
jgi:hypothetical protein